MAASEVTALMREFYITEIGTWENYGGKHVWRFFGGGGGDNIYKLILANQLD